MASGVTEPSENMDSDGYTIMYLKKIMKSYGKQQARDQAQCEKVPAACTRWLCLIIELLELHNLTSSRVKFKIERSAFYYAQ